MWLADAPRLRRIVCAYALSELGGWFALVALPLAVYGHTHSSVAVGGLLAAGVLPAALAPAIVARVEMMERRGGVAFLFVIAGAAAAVVALLLWRFWLPGIFPTYAIQSGATFAGVALLRSEAARSERVGGDRRCEGGEPTEARQTADFADVEESTLDQATLHRANAAFNLAMSIGMVAGPALAGFAISGLGGAPALLIATGALLASSITVVRLKIHHIPSPASTLAGRLAEAFAHIRKAPSIGRLMRAEALALLFFTAVVPIEVAYAKSTLHAGSRGYGILITTWGVGMIVGSLTFGHIGRAGVMRGDPATAHEARSGVTQLRVTLLLGTAAVSVAYVGFAFAPTLAPAALAGFLGGIGNGVQWAAFLGIIQSMTPPRLLGRTMGATEALRSTTPVLGFLLGGTMASLWSTRIALLIAGGCMLGPVLLLLRALRSPSAATSASATGEMRVGALQHLLGSGSPPDLAKQASTSDRAENLAPQRTTANRRRTSVYLALSLLLLAGSVSVTALLTHWHEWHPVALILILAALVLSGELMRGSVNSQALSSSFIALTFAACLLGPGPTIAIAMLGAYPGSPVTRRVPRYWIANYCNAAVVGLAMALFVRLVIGTVHSPLHRHLIQSLTIGLVVIAVVLLAEILNALLVAWGCNAFWALSVRKRLRELLTPLLTVDVIFALIAAVIVLGYARFGLIVWALGLPALIAYQYLSQQLVRSQVTLGQLTSGFPVRRAAQTAAPENNLFRDAPHTQTSASAPNATTGRLGASMPGGSSTRVVWVFYLLCIVLATGSITVSVLTLHSGEWHPITLFALLAILAFFGEQLLITIRGQPISATFVALTLAMVLLGAAPAVAIGIGAMVYTSAKRRLPPRFWLANIASFAFFPLVGAEIAQRLAGNIHARSIARLNQGVTFGEVVFLVFLITMVLNFLLIAIAARVLWNRRLSDQFRELFTPILPAQLALGALTTIAAVAYMHFGVSVLLGGLALLALFQYLMTRLVRSEDRLTQLMQEAMHRAAMEVGALSFAMRSLDARAPDAGRHAAAVARYAEELVRHLGHPASEQRAAHSAGLFHDIGMIAFPDRIFHVDAVIDEEERSSIRRHPIDGAAFVGYFPDFRLAADAISSHHERWDGTGYPDGLIASEIPLIARVVAICEAYDVMTAETSYRDPVNNRIAIDELRANAGSQFDPELTEAFIALLETSDALEQASVRLAVELDIERQRLLERAAPEGEANRVRRLKLPAGLSIPLPRTKNRPSDHSRTPQAVA